MASTRPVDGMVYARPKIPPTRNGPRVRSIDDSAAKSVKGYIKSLALDDPSNTVPGWVMVFARTLIRPPTAPPTWSRWIGSPATPRKSPSRMSADHGAKLIADPSGGSTVGGRSRASTRRSPPRSRSLGRTYTTSSVLHVPARAGQRARFREGWHLRDPHRQSVADPDPARARQGAGRVPRTRS